MLAIRAPRMISVVVIVAALGVLWSMRMTSASPSLQGAPTCQWIQLARLQNRAQETLVQVPGKGVLAFGGLDLRAQASQTTVKDDLWMLDLTGGGAGSGDSVQATGSGPGNRALHAAALRSMDNAKEMITYGGVDAVPTSGGGGGGGGGGTFTWSSPLIGGGSSGAFGQPEVGWDASVVGSRLGEFSPEAAVQNAVHVLSLGETLSWSSVAAQGQPRIDHSVIYFPDEDSLISFGGRRGDDIDSTENTTWKLTLGAAKVWTRFDAPGGPSKRFAHTAIYDGKSKRMIVYGGTTDFKTGMSELYALDLSKGTAGATWSSLNATGAAPPKRYEHVAVYLPNHNWMAVYGGSSNGRDALNDAWLLNLSVSPPAWIKLNLASPRPPALMTLAGAYSDVNDSAIFYGGQSDGVAKNQAWALKCEPVTAPTPMPTTPGPVPTTAVPPTSVPPTDTPVAPTPTAVEVTPTTAPQNLADLMISSARIDMRGYTGGCMPKLGSLFTKVCIKNSGAAASGGFTVRGEPYGGGQHTDWTWQGLAVGQEACQEYDMVLGKVTADADNLVAESNEGNNSYMLPIPTAPPTCTPAPQGLKIYLPVMLRGAERTW